MDIATALGVICGFVVIFGTITFESHGKMAIFFNIPAIAIVVGGTICATMIHFSMKQFLGVLSVVKKTLLTKITAPQEVIQRMVNYSAVNRRDGALALEQEIGKIKDPFLSKGLQMLVDGADEHAIRDLLGLEIQYMEERHSMGKKILDFMGASAPSFAMVGTLIGLISMLSNMESPDEIGAGMATALVCTFYGALVANLVFIPMGGKLGQYSKAEKISMEMVVEGVCCIAKGDNPTAVGEKMQVFISTKHREAVKAQV
ncbi:MAG: motility protein A [Phycisphaerae bacterium]|nr:motility protein A [Phycisphaerae bacterium]